MTEFRITKRKLALFLLVIIVVVSSLGLAAGNADRQNALADLKNKAGMVKEALRERRKQGHDVSSILKMMDEVQSRAESGELEQAVQILDEILNELQGEPTESVRVAGEASPQLISTADACTKYNGQTGELGFAGNNSKEVSNGRIDPSVEADPISGRLWMAYSGLESDFGPSKGTSFRISQQLAYSDDSGASWCDRGTIVPVEDVPTDNCPEWQNKKKGPCHFNMETSSLVYVPFAPAAKRWKHFVFKVPVLNAGGTHFPFSWYEVREASSPTELATASARKLFHGTLYERRPEIKTWVDQWGGPIETIVSKFPTAGDCFQVAEMGTEIVDGYLYVSFLCAAGKNARIVLIRTSDPEMTNWEWVGSVLPPSSANVVVRGAKNYSASDLFTGNDGKVRIVVSPSLKNLYQGCAVYVFDDIASATLLPDVELFIPKPKASSHAGMCTYHAGSSASGLIFSQQFPEVPTMRMIATGKSF